MPDPKRSFSVLRFIAVLAVIGLFVSDYVLDIMAKSPPMWAYVIPGLLALGIEGPALRRLVLQAVKVIARIPDDRGDK